MTESITATETTTEPTTTSVLAAACALGTVQLYRERGTGTLRHLDYLTGEAREVAEWYAERRESGLSVRTIATEAATSTSTVRRVLKALELTEAIEAGDHDDLWAEDLEALIFSGEEEAEAVMQGLEALDCPGGEEAHHAHLELNGECPWCNAEA